MRRRSGAGEAKPLCAQPPINRSPHPSTETGQLQLNESDFANNSASRVVVLGEPLGVGPGDLPSGLRLDPPYPNPTSTHVVLAFTVPLAGAGALEIYDLLGRRVCEWRWTHLAPGRHVVEWDGRRSSGQRLSPGVYLCRLEVGDERIQRKVVLRR